MSKTKKRRIVQYKHLTKVVIISVVFLLLLGATTLAVRLTQPQNSNAITNPGPHELKTR